MRATLAEKVSIRWAIRRDVPEIMTIESEGVKVEDAFSEGHLLSLFKKRHVGIVADLDGEVVGYALYAIPFNQSYISLDRLVVHSGYRRVGIGGLLMSWLKRRLIPVDNVNGNARKQILAGVAEDLLSVQLFLKAQSFDFLWNERESAQSRDIMGARRDTYWFTYHGDVGGN